MRTIPLSQAHLQGYNTVFGCWSEKKIQGWSRKKVGLAVCSAVENCKHWNEHDFTLFIAREMQGTSVCDRIERAKKGLQPDQDRTHGYHFILQFNSRTKALAKLEPAFKALGHKVQLQVHPSPLDSKKLLFPGSRSMSLSFLVQVMYPGHGINPLIAPLDYLLKYDPDKFVDPEPYCGAGFKIPAQVIANVRKQSERMKNKAFQETEAQAFLLERPRLLRKKSKAEMTSAVVSMVAQLEKGKQDPGADSF